MVTRLLLFIILVGTALGQTTNLGLNVPANGTLNWDTAPSGGINQNWAILDAQVIAKTPIADQTISGAHALLFPTGSVNFGAISALSAYAQSTLPAYIGPAPLILYTPSTAAANSFVAWNEAASTNSIYGVSYGSNSDKYGVEGDAYTTGAVRGTGLYGYAQANAANATSLTGVYGVATSFGPGTVNGALAIAASVFADTVAVPLTGGAQAAGVWVVDQGSNFAIKTGTGAVSIGGQLQSTVTTGTAPLTITSTTPVANLTTVPVTYNHSGTQQTATHIVRDRCTLGTDCSVTLAGSAVFTSSSSYDCTVSDRTAANAVKFDPTSGSAFALTGTGTDLISYLCVGN